MDARRQAEKFASLMQRDNTYTVFKAGHLTAYGLVIMPQRSL